MKSSISDLPDDVAAVIRPHVAESTDTLDAISLAIAAKRDEARAARTASGIEQVWTEAEEAYIGIDDANRHEFKAAAWTKPMSAEGPVTTGRSPRETDYKSTAFVRMTARYVDAGSGKLTEILLPADDKSFSFSETPVPELVKAKDDLSQVVHDGMGNAPLTRPAKPGEAPPTDAVSALGASLTASAPLPPPVPGAVPAGTVGTPPAGTVPPAPQVPLTVADLAKENIERAHDAAKAAEERIYDWQVESQYTAAMRKVIFDAAKLGVGVLKAPFPASSKNIATKKGQDGTVEVIIERKINPSSKHVDPWNIFPDPGCGENIHDGDHILERDYMSKKQIRDLKKTPGYIAAQIDKILEEGPQAAGGDGASDNGFSNGPNKPSRKNRFEVWYFYGTLTRAEMATIGQSAGKQFALSDDQDEVYAIVTLINSSVVRATINPLDSGSFPYHSVPWQRRAGYWAGIGVAEQCSMPQKMINAATRAMLNNAGKSSGSQIVLDRGMIVPADGNFNIYPDKIWLRTGDAMGMDIRMAMMAIGIPNVTPQMLSIIEYALKLAEESTSIPLITQGQSGATTPETYGAAQIQNSNANQLLRAIGYSFDDYITEPVVRQYYEWLLLDPDVPDEEKGDFTINAHGSIALVERAIADQFLWSMANVVGNQAFGVDPKKWMTLFLKSKRVDPSEVQYTKEQQDKIDQSPPPPVPQVQAAQINADTQLKLGVMKQTTDQQSVQSEEKIAQAAQALEGQKTQVQATVDLHKLLEQTKAQLAAIAMKLDTERQLNAINNDHELNRDAASAPAMTPPAQVPGRAADGHAFDQAS